MRISRWFLTVPLALAMPLAQAVAQTCHGASSFANGPMRIGVGAEFHERATGYQMGGAFGAPRNWYASAAVAQMRIDGTTQRQNGFGGSLGYQLKFDNSPAELCPYGTLGYSSIGSSNFTTWGFGGGIGYPLTGSDNVQFVPAVGVQWQSRSGTGPTTNDAFWWLNAGFVLNRRWTVTPGVMIPTANGADNVLTLGLGFNWGR